ncbi:hypothetical protein A9Q93_13135 [Nonlabens dokdonensis]|uniref:C1q domain-containing protein n=1 Tax=Nonlabens dokdonensis TaxID=328515 RepID=A0A1Z8AIF7_9FLAO|nr:hypothetical protein [Nonlabens dokdonensis]OUS10120.1 hypothetical protein A9Q93_13135 [Nonlabens dokdonensis]
MKYSYLIPLLLINFLSYSQVGIGTSSPTADLEVISKSGLSSGEFNGIIVPKVSVLPTGVNLPTDSQSGLILYLDSNDAAEGFYFFNGTSYQSVNASSAFYTDGTTNNATSTTSEIVRTGRTSFGTESVAAAVVTVENAGASASEDRIILSVNNRHTSTVGTSIALDIENTADTNADKIGIKNVLGVTGNGAHIGIDNSIAVRNSGTAANFGIRNVIGASTTSGQDINGISTTAGNTSATGTVYGIRSIALNDGANNAYSGYFQGDHFAIRSGDNSTGYEMPTNNGAAGQVLTTNGAGVASWQTNSVKDIARANLSSTVTTGSIASNNTDYFTIPFDNDSIDNDGRFDTTNHDFTVNQDGFYEIYAQYHTEGEDNLGIYGIGIYVGTTLVAVSEYQHTGNVFGSSANGIVFRSVTDILELSNGDVLTIRARFDDISSNNVDGSSVKTFVTIKQL